MKTKSFYNKPIAKVVKIDCVYLQNTISGYGPGGTGQQSVSVSMSESTEMEQE
jgi:hypothetical protein